MASNETDLCELVIVLFEKRLGATRADVTHPEKDGSGPPVECRLRIGATRFAFETHIDRAVREAHPWRG